MTLRTGISAPAVWAPTPPPSHDVDRGDVAPAVNPCERNR